MLGNKCIKYGYTCNKLQLIIGHGTHKTDISKPTFNYHQDGSLAVHEVQLKSTMGNLVCDTKGTTRAIAKTEKNKISSMSETVPNGRS